MSEYCLYQPEYRDQQQDYQRYDQAHAEQVAYREPRTAVATHVAPSLSVALQGGLYIGHWPDTQAKRINLRTSKKVKQNEVAYVMVAARRGRSVNTIRDSLANPWR